jgi:uncharacterized membrane protein
VRLTSGQVLGGFLLGAGIAHFAVPGVFDPLVPEALPGSQRAWTYGSGLVELAVGASVLTPATRRKGALAAAALFVAVYPGNIKQAVDADTGKEKAISYARLPLQVPLVVWALKVSRREVSTASGRRESPDRAR